MGNTRRELLLVSGAIFGIAGCTGDNGRGSGTPESTATPTREHQEEDSHDQGSHEEGTESHDEKDHQHGETSDKPADHAEVAMVTSEDGTGFHFEPHVAWVHPGGTVSWTLESGDHSTTAYHPDNDRPRRMPANGNAWDSGILTNQEASFKHTFETVGVYDYYCIPHEAMGMIGSIVVGRPGPDDQPGLAAPQADLPEQARETIDKRNATVEELLEGEHDDE
jgi:plastocyanin